MNDRRRSRVVGVGVLLVLGAMGTAPALAQESSDALLVGVAEDKAASPGALVQVLEERSGEAENGADMKPAAKDTKVLDLGSFNGFRGTIALLLLLTYAGALLGMAWMQRSLFSVE